MQYSLIVYQSEAQFAARKEPGRQEVSYAAFMGYANALREAGVFITALGLQSPETATSIRVVDGETRVQDGPYAETKEQLGGLFVIDVPNLDAALGWAAKLPFEYCRVVEVRPTSYPPPNATARA
jgi:hypothetical protein